IRDLIVTGVQTCALPICLRRRAAERLGGALSEARRGDEYEVVFTLPVGRAVRQPPQAHSGTPSTGRKRGGGAAGRVAVGAKRGRSEERRVGKEGRARGWG